MKKNYAIGYFLAFTFLNCSVLFAFQGKQKLWNQLSQDSRIETAQWERKTMPNESVKFSLDITSIETILDQAPSRKTSSVESGIVIDFPYSDGSMRRFKVLEASVLHPELQERHPNIRSYVGYNMDDPSNTIRFSISHKGLNAIILNSEIGTQYIDCITKDRETYIAYAKQSIPALEDEFSCSTEDMDIDFGDQNSDFSSRNADDGQMREFAMALGCTEEYATYHVNQAGLSGGTDAEKKAAVLAVMNDVMTRVNAVYENELSVTMTLVPTNENIIFLTDTFLTNNNLNNLINESQQFIDAFVGSLYDIGHMLCTGPGGLAQLFSPCTGNKARGVTGSGVPAGTGFEGILMHELGHQYGSPHTFNGNAGSCLNNISTSSAYEPGSGTTIMAYPGICSSQNIQVTRDLYFHQRSLQMMWDNISFGNSTCAPQTATGNRAPTSDAGSDYVIPIGTPYKLTGSSSDLDGVSTHTFCWEQYDLGPSGVPSPTTLQGPLVRSFPPSSSNERYIPRLEDYVNNVGSSTTWENLMLLERAITYRLTVRDNDIRGGQIGQDEMIVTVTNTAGPFRVTSQNLFNTTYTGGSTQTVTWNVASTDTGLTSTSNVNILLSTDGGLTFDTILASNTPNDGSEDITIPNVDAASCRVMVEAVGNIFYNLNVQSFAIQANLSVGDNIFEDGISLYPNPSTGTFTVDIATLANNDDVKIKMYDIRGREVLSKSYTASSEFQQTIRSSAQAGLYLIKIEQGTSSAVRKLVIK